MLYRPDLAARVLAYLDTADSGMTEHLVCCRHDPQLSRGTVVINTCAGCDKRYRELYDGVSTVSLWEVLADSDTFEFPDYGGAEMTIHDACPTRTEARVHDAVRTLLDRMNIVVVEPPSTRTRAVCCGDSFFGQLPDDAVKGLMAKRADSMPRQDVVVYCVSCVKAMHIGGRRPRYVVDLLFGEETEPGAFDPSVWHATLEGFVASH
jgi:Fe-S oxidoreductase